MPAPLGQYGGLAYWDANTFYLSGDRALVELAVSPFGAAKVQSYTGNIASLERDGDELVGITDTSELVRFVPRGSMTVLPLVDSVGTPIPVSGGDLTHMPDGRWLWFGNTQGQLYDLNVATGVGTRIGGGQPDIPFVGGVVHDDEGRLYLTSGDTDELIEISPTTGAPVATTTVCLPCPTTYDLLSGDMTRTP